MVGAAFERSRGLATAAATVALFCFCADAVRKVPGAGDGPVGVEHVQERTAGESDARAHFLDDMKPEGALEEDSISCYHGRVFTIRLPESEPAKKDGSFHHVSINSTAVEGSPPVEVYVDVKDNKREFLLIPPAGSVVEHWMLLYRRAASQTSNKDWPWVEERLFKLGNMHPCSVADAATTPQSSEAEALARAAAEAEAALNATSRVPPSWMAYDFESKEEVMASMLMTARSSAAWAARKVKSALPFGRSGAEDQASSAAGPDAVGEADAGADDSARAAESVIARARTRIQERVAAAEELAHRLSAGRTRAAQRAVVERYERTRDWLAARGDPHHDDSDAEHEPPAETAADTSEPNPPAQGAKASWSDTVRRVASAPVKLAAAQRQSINRAREWLAAGGDLNTEEEWQPEQSDDSAEDREAKSSWADSVRSMAAVPIKLAAAPLKSANRARDWLRAGGDLNTEEEWEPEQQSASALAGQENEEEVKADVAEVNPAAALSASASQEQFVEVGAPEIVFEAGAGGAKDEDEDALSTGALAPEVVGS